LFSAEFSYKENAVCNCCRKIGHFLFCIRQFALHRQQPEKDEQNVALPPLSKFLRTPMAADIALEDGEHVEEIAND